MFKQILFLLCAILVVVNAHVLTPRDLIDEIGQQIEELGSIVQGEIFVAHDDLSNMQTDFQANSINLIQTSAMNIHREAQSLNERIAMMKYAATAAGVDSSPCTSIREADLNRLLTSYVNESHVCIFGVASEGNQTTDDARYRVDIVVNKVNQLEFQLNQCMGNFECAAPLSTEIALDKIRLPANIKTEVQATIGFLTNLRLIMKSCSDNAVSAYVSEASAVVREIIDCINRLLE